ncbi:unnamed protein product, partial [marine sediment metagenome]
VRCLYVVIKEIVENLIHANFNEVVVSIYKDGNVIRISDQGPGITDKKKAILPGFTTAKEDMKRYIRGVGSGLPIAKESIELSGGSMNIDDNLSYNKCFKGIFWIKVPVFFNLRFTKFRKERYFFSRFRMGIN